MPKRKIRDRVASSPALDGQIRDVHLTIKLRNNQLMERRLASGLTQMELAEASGVNINNLGPLETMRLSPVRTIKDRHCRAPACGKGTFAHAPFCPVHSKAPEADRSKWMAEYVPIELTAWTSDAEKLAAFFCVSPEVLFPDSLRAIQKTTIVSTLDVPQLLAIAGLASGEPSAAPPMIDGVEAREVSGALSTALSKLSPRQEKILRMRFGLEDDDEKTLSEVGEEFDLQSERIRQIEKKALRKLRGNLALRKSVLP